MTTPSEDSIAQSEAIAALAKHSWHLNIESINSNTPLSLSVAYLIFLSLGLVACAPTISTAKPTPVLVLSSSGRTMDGPYPTYKFEIYEDGFVHYHGDINVKTIGDRQAKITPEQVQQLIATYRKIEEVFKEYERGTGTKLTAGHAGHHLFRLQYQDETSQLGVGGFANNNLSSG